MKIIGWGVCALIVLGIISSMAGGSASSDVSADTAAKGESGKSEEAAKAGVVGQVVKNAGTEYAVTKVRTTKTLGDQEYGLGETAAGTFVIVGLELTNRKNETKTFSDANAKLVTADGNAYESSTEANFQLKDDLMMEDMQPDLTTRGSIGFDVPEAKVAGAKLVIEDLWGSGEVTIDLGL